MKELFTLDNFMVAFISALGYGFGEIIARLSGWPELLCIAASMALGVISEGIINRIVFCKAVQKSRTNRIITYAAILLIFQLAQYFSTRWMGISMLEYLQDQFLYVVGLPIVGFVVNLLIRRYRVWRIQERYGDGSKNYEDAVNRIVTNLQGHLDGSMAETVQAYIKAQTAASSEIEAKSKLLGQWFALGTYRIAAKLSKGGNRVHLMYWDEKALIENLGSGTADVLATLLGNDEALQTYGSMINEELSEMVQALLMKYINGEPLQLYHNEIPGIDEFDWKAYPLALIVSDGKIMSDTIEGRITEDKGLLEFMLQ